MISAQLGTEFSIPRYDDIKKVTSIWICMDSKGREGNTISEYRLSKNDLLGNFPDRPKAYDKLSVVIVALDEKQKSRDEFINMMNTLLSTQKPAELKKKELLEQYHLPMEHQLGKEIDIMCNLSEVVEKKGIEKGIEKGRSAEKQSFIAKLLIQGILTRGQIAEAAGVTEEYVDEISARTNNL